MEKSKLAYLFSVLQITGAACERTKVPVFQYFNVATFNSLVHLCSSLIRFATVKCKCELRLTTLNMKESTT